MNIKNIYAFDFDNTFVKQPDIYKWNPMADEEDNDYMESTKSLDYKFEINDEIKEQFLKAQNCEESLAVILTNRTIKLRNEVLDILSDHGISFDATLFRIADRSKGNRLDCFLRTISGFHTIENVHFWDDKTKHINDVERITEKHPDINFELTLYKY
ncbi:MAG: putative hydrolase [uncultured marine phage]|uniref:Putative hydrolase n=1 Tax=uncultured marine phage TaxID=707152 RepID=A0A8D9CCN4_9VIRU|nr:MAG: putative hydrolase [uncultured marine phage]